jgi:arsenite-transporting ATPase
MFDSRILERKIVFFGGKGGTGKTVCAAATGFWAAKKGKKALVFSSNPAHSLSDLFDQEVGNKITQINGVENLYAYEADPHQRLKELKDEYMPYIDRAVHELGKGPVSLERDMLEEFFDLIPPGLDELSDLEKLNNLLKGRDGGEFDMIVVDTAAGAHALRLLESPRIINEVLEKSLRILDRVLMREIPRLGPLKVKMRHLAPIHRLRSKLEELADDAKRFMFTITNPETTFIVVTIPELMGVFVTSATIETLKKIGVFSDVIVVNYLAPHSDCSFCSSVREGQIKRVQEIRDKFPKHRIIEVPLFPRPILGLEALADFAQALFEGYKPEGVEVKAVPEVPSLDTRTPRLEFPTDLKLVIFGGKGGCGKTTCAAVAGIRMAGKGKKVLIVSTDPQRSLSDSLGQKLPVSRTLPLLEKIIPVDGVPNLYALEIDTEAVIDDFKKRYETAIMQLAVGATKLREDEIRSFFSIPSFPGADEMVALWKVSKILGLREYDTVILDTAPTGHTMRFLELPDASVRWLKFLVKVRAKTRHLQRFFKRGQKYEADFFLEEAIEDDERILKAFRDPLTEFVLVTTLDEMALEEVKRFLKVLRSREIPVRQMIINKLISLRKCGYCMSSFNLQEEELSETTKTFSELRLVGVPHLGHEVQGIDELKNFGQILFGK